MTKPIKGDTIKTSKIKKKINKKENYAGEPATALQRKN